MPFSCLTISSTGITCAINCDIFVGSGRETKKYRTSVFVDIWAWLFITCTCIINTILPVPITLDASLFWISEKGEKKQLRYK